MRVTLGKALQEALGDTVFTLLSQEYVSVRTHHRAELGEALPRWQAFNRSHVLCTHKDNYELLFLPAPGAGQLPLPTLPQHVASPQVQRQWVREHNHIPTA